MTFEHSLSFPEELSRFFMQTTFGATKMMLDNWEYSQNEMGMAEWAQDQMYDTPATLHRAYFRERLDHSYKWDNTDETRFNMIPRDPCKAYSRWKNYTFDEYDANDSSAAFTVTLLSGGRKLISKRGVPRTVVDKLEYHEDRSPWALVPGNYYLCKYEFR